jgi:hypothetical protein
MTDRKTARVLLRAAAWVALGHTKGAPARDEKGEPVAAMSLAAVAWCLTGALYRAADADEGAYKRARAAVRQALSSYAGPTILEWNDAAERRKRDVVALLRRAAKAVERGG